MASDPAKLNKNMDLDSIEQQLKEVHDLSLKLVEEVLEEKIEYETLFGRAEMRPVLEQGVRADATYTCVKLSEPEDSMTLQKMAETVKSNVELPEDTQFVAASLKEIESNKQLETPNQIEELKEKLNELNEAKLLQIKMFDKIAADVVKQPEKEPTDNGEEPEPVVIPNPTNLPVAFAMLPEENFTKLAEKNDPDMKFFFGSLENVKSSIEKFELKVEPEIEPALEPMIEKILEPTIKKIFEPTFELEIEPKVEAEIEPKVEVEIEPKVEVEIEPKVEPALEPKVEININPAIEKNLESIFEPKVEPEIEPKVEVKFDPTIEKIFESIFEPKAEPEIEPPVEPIVINIQLNDQSQSVFELAESVQDAAEKLLKDSEQVLEQFETTEIPKEISTTGIQLPFLTKLKRAAFGFAPQEELVELKKQQKLYQTPVEATPVVLEASKITEVSAQDCGLVEKLVTLGLIDSYPDDDDGFGVESSSTFEESFPSLDNIPVEDSFPSIENIPVEGNFIFMANIPADVTRIEQIIPVESISIEDNEDAERSLEIENWEFKAQQSLPHPFVQKFPQPFPKPTQESLLEPERVQHQNKTLRRCEAAEDLSLIGSSEVSQASEASSSMKSDTTGSQKYTGTIKKGFTDTQSQEVEIEKTCLLSHMDIEPLPMLKSVTTLSSLQHMCKPGVVRDVEAKSNGEDDDGYSNLPEVPSGKVSRVMSSAWIDNSIDFTVDEKESMHNRAPLGQAGDSKNKFSVEDTCKPIVKEAKKNNKYKFFFKRISKIFRKTKD